MQKIISLFQRDYDIARHGATVTRDGPTAFEVGAVNPAPSPRTAPSGEGPRP